MREYNIDVIRVNPLMMLNAKYGLRTMKGSNRNSTK